MRVHPFSGPISPRSADKGEKMTRSFLAEETGETLADWPEAGLGADGGLDCAKASCLYTARGRTVAIITGEAASPLKCGGLDAIVSQVPAGFPCRSVMPVVDRIDSWRRGAVALWLDAQGLTVQRPNGTRENLPCVPH